MKCGECMDKNGCPMYAGHEDDENLCLYEMMKKAKENA